jgi:hypothetical protein
LLRDECYTRKLLAVALGERLVEQLAVLAGLTSISLEEALRQAVKAFVDDGRRQRLTVDRATEELRRLSDLDVEVCSRRDAIRLLYADNGPDAEPVKSENSRASQSFTGMYL